MGKTFKVVLRGLTNGATEPQTVTGQAGSQTIKNMTAEQRKLYRDMAHKALRAGLTVFMSQETVAAFGRILNTEVNSRLMRKLLEEIGNGELVLAAPGQHATASLYKQPTTSPTLGNGRAIPVVLATEQLTGGLPLSLKQAAKILKVTPNMLYFRCITGRIHFEKDRSRYYIPATEVQRLQVIGI